jgi:hypothetical protein
VRETNNHTVFSDSIDGIWPGTTGGEMLAAKSAAQKSEYLLPDITVSNKLNSKSCRASVG